MVFTFRTAQNPLIFPLWLVVGGVVWYIQQAPQDARLLGSPGGIDMLLSMTRTLPEKILRTTDTSLFWQHPQSEPMVFFIYKVCLNSPHLPYKMASNHENVRFWWEFSKFSYFSHDYGFIMLLVFKNISKSFQKSFFMFVTPKMTLLCVKTQKTIFFQNPIFGAQIPLKFLTTSYTIWHSFFQSLMISSLKM